MLRGRGNRPTWLDRTWQHRGHGKRQGNQLAEQRNGDTDQSSMTAHHAAGQARPDDALCRFELAPPRRFVYPVVLLLVAEEPMHGYRLVRCLRDLCYGPVNRPNVYRALADLEHDRLVESWEEQPAAGSMRHVYGITAAGRSQLAAWMEVVDGERDVLDHVLARFASIDSDEARPCPIRGG